jgi:GntR family transcriptional regulator
MTVLDRTSPLPLWAQVADDLRRALASGSRDPHLPSEPELAREYEVSRHTIREALRHLEQEGLLERARGRGTVLVAPRLEQPLEHFYRLADTISARGLIERSEVLAADVRPAGSEAEHLGIAPDDAVVFIERLRYAGTEPIAHDRSSLPADRARRLLSAGLTGGSLYDALSVTCGVVPTAAREWIRPGIPSPYERRLLNLGRAHAVFLVDRLAHAGADPIEFRHTVIRGDRYQFVADLGNAMRR